MEQNQITESKKRSLSYVAAQELSWKFKAKEDFMRYFREASKFFTNLAHFTVQCNSTCPQKPWSTKTFSGRYSMTRRFCHQGHY